LSINQALENEIKERVLDNRAENPRKALAEVLHKQASVLNANEQKKREV